MRHRRLVKAALLETLGELVAVEHEGVIVTDVAKQTNREIWLGDMTGALRPVTGNGRRRIFEDDFTIEGLVVVVEHDVDAGEAEDLAADITHTLLEIFSDNDELAPIHAASFSEQTGQLKAIGLQSVDGPTSRIHSDGGTEAMFSFDVGCIYRTN